MKPAIGLACAAGYERLVAWSALLDEINVFPVADADTGRNLQISLAPLRSFQGGTTASQLLRAATGNSGNIAAAFFAAWLAAEDPAQLPLLMPTARQAAWQAMTDPQPGTMLTVFDTLADGSGIAQTPLQRTAAETLLKRLQSTVATTAGTLSIMRRAGVVDAGALGMYLFFEGFFHHLAQLSREPASPLQQFTTGLKLAPGWQPAPSRDLCVDTRLRPRADLEKTIREVSRLGRSVIVQPDRDHLKIHLHTDRADAVRRSLENLGQVAAWQQEVTSPPTPLETPSANTTVRIVTDAAGSLTRQRARELGISLLESYVIIDGHPCPETLVPPDTLYAAMRRGIRATTAQASNFERHQCYQSLIERYDRVLYITVGSVYTGNFDTARTWQAQNDRDGHLRIVDSGTASGRLALIAGRMAAYARQHPQATLDQLAEHTRLTINNCHELVFLDRLKYLAAGGRVSKARGFIADGLRLKPVISPMPDGARKVGVLKNRQAQLRFALSRMREVLPEGTAAELLLQYTDNRRWVTETAQTALQAHFPEARIEILPMSLTSGTHMGPGTWGVAYIRHDTP